MYYIMVYWVSMHLYWLLVIIYIYIIKLKTIWNKSVLSDTRIIENRVRTDLLENGQWLYTRYISRNDQFTP